MDSSLPAPSPPPFAVAREKRVYRVRRRATTKWCAAEPDQLGTTAVGLLGLRPRRPAACFRGTRRLRRAPPPPLPSPAAAAAASLPLLAAGGGLLAVPRCHHRLARFHGACAQVLYLTFKRGQASDGLQKNVLRDGREKQAPFFVERANRTVCVCACTSGMTIYEYERGERGLSCSRKTAGRDRGVRFERRGPLTRCSGGRPQPIGWPLANPCESALSFADAGATRHAPHPPARPRPRPCLAPPRAQRCSRGGGAPHHSDLPTHAELRRRLSCRPLSWLPTPPGLPSRGFADGGWEVWLARPARREDNKGAGETGVAVPRPARPSTLPPSHTTTTATPQFPPPPPLLAPDAPYR